MKKLAADLVRRYRAHHEGNPGLLQGIGIVGALAYPAIYMLRFTGRLPPLYDDLPWRLVAVLLCLGLATRKYWPKRLQRHYTAYSWVAVFYSLAFLLPFMLLQNNASTPSVANMVVSVVLIILLTDWRNTLLMLITGYAAAFGVYWLVQPQPSVPVSFLIWWIPLSSVLVASGSISKYVEKRAELERMRRLYSGLAGSVAHETRTPLSQVQHVLDTIEADLRGSSDQFGAVLDRADVQQLLSTVAQGRQSVNRGLQAITITLQQLSGRGLDARHFTRLSAASCIKKAVDEFAYESTQQRDRVRIRIVDDFDFVGDETAMVLVLFNLLKNALYYLALQPEATITITTKREPQNCIVVRDTGPGIHSEVIGGLFEEFKSTGKADGTGLGLAFCRRAMRAFGGDIGCHSKLGVFTEFTLTFPETLAVEKPLLAPESIQGAKQASLAGHKILVVDDSAFNRKIAMARLGEMGAHTMEAQHGVEALRMIDAGVRPAAILMDMQMPGMSGIEATRALRSRTAPINTIPILGLSATDLPSWRDSALEAGMDGYLTKPLDIDLLNEELARVLKVSASKPGSAIPYSTSRSVVEA